MLRAPDTGSTQPSRNSDRNPLNVIQCLRDESAAKRLSAGTNAQPTEEFSTETDRDATDAKPRRRICGIVLGVLVLLFASWKIYGKAKYLFYTDPVYVAQDGDVELYLMRHGQSEANKLYKPSVLNSWLWSFIFNYQKYKEYFMLSDPLLTTKGIAQARRSGTELARLEIKSFIMSPLRRCAMTLHHATHGLGIPAGTEVVVSPDLQERNYSHSVCGRTHGGFKCVAAKHLQAEYDLLFEKGEGQFRFTANTGAFGSQAPWRVDPGDGSTHQAGAAAFEQRWCGMRTVETAEHVNARLSKFNREVLSSDSMKGGFPALMVTHGHLNASIVELYGRGQFTKWHTRMMHNAQFLKLTLRRDGGGLFGIVKIESGFDPASVTLTPEELETAKNLHPYDGEYQIATHEEFGGSRRLS